MPRPPRVDHDQNVIAAAAAMLADRVRTAVEDATDAEGASATALTALSGWADGSHIDALASGLRLSHSRTVRVVDRLETRGFAGRRPDPTDARRALVWLTPEGRRMAELALAARAAAIEDLLSDLSADDQVALARVAENLLTAQATTRAEARAMCRMCDTRACGHADGTCPSTAGADARGL